MFVDRVTIFVKGGDGGKGCCSFRRERKVPRRARWRRRRQRRQCHLPRRGRDRQPGPNRQSQILESSQRRPGTGANKHGKQGKDLIIAVPPGTIISTAIAATCCVI